MYANNFYYFLKMFIPRPVQIYMRRQLIRHKLYRHQDTWPIDPAAAKLPANWQGWPEGKRFAFVLTHDVETKKGLLNCRNLMDIEEKHGFRSSFNFVAGDYEVPQDLLHEMKSRGFEAGIHGLHHRGNLFRSRHFFLNQAREINQWIKKWNAAGFRAPSMYHNLEWLHDLDIQYDASTFDTDPFEPQPDAAGTIFPFWVPGRNNTAGYVELPYTLPQDFLLYILMQEESTRIWQQKLDWVVQKGGMALFITHPDYINFNGTTLREDEYPVKQYKEFLRHVSTKYAGQYWHALPREVAIFWKAKYRQQTHMTKRKTRTRVCMLTYSFYTNDARVRRYAETLASRGDHVDVLALGNTNEKSHEVLNSVHVYRIQERTRNERGKFDYLLKILTFVINSSYHLTKKHIKLPYNLIHVHSVPDFEVFAAFLPKITGAKIILDIHDPVPDFYQAKFGTDNQTYYKALSFIEKISSKFAHHIITVTHFWMNKIAQRSNIADDKISVTLNLPDIKMFNYANVNKPKKENENFTVIYPGTINKHCGLEIAIRAIDIASKDIPKLKFIIYGSGPEMDNLIQLIKELKLENIVFFRGNVPLESIPGIMIDADIGIALLAGHDDYAQQALNVKLFEYLSMGLPAIATRTKSIEYYLEEGTVMLSNPNDPDDVAKCIIELYSHPEKRMDLKERGLNFIAKNNSIVQMNDYIRIVDKLTA
jgi:glycosyltransferase involved in cell wall biosynthesis/peptidoglycan/xylan/chitin deacetylase (PgdA/CDA1 family)